MNKKRCLVIVAVAVLLLASSCAASLITILEAEPNWTAPLDSLQVTCIASDPDGSELSYEWSTTEGNITGTGPEVIWTAPEEVGMYDITVVVSDSQGRKDTESIALFASNGPPPVIEDLIVTAKGHEYLKKPLLGTRLRKQENTILSALLQIWTTNPANLFMNGHAMAAKFPGRAPWLPGLPRIRLVTLQSR